MEIIDVVLGRDEIDLLKFRVGYLEGVASKTYVGESRSTHSYQSKPLYFQEIAGRAPEDHTRWESTEIPEPDEQMQALGPWAFEQHSRDWLVSEVIKRHPDALILLCDIDEVPSREQVLLGVDWLKPGKVGSFPMKFSYRRGNWVFRPSKNYWTKAKMFHASDYEPGLRLRKTAWIPGDPGVHFSFVGLPPQKIGEKLKSYAHNEYARDELSAPELMAFCDFHGIDHLGRAFAWGNGVFKWEAFEELSEVQRQARRMFPHWFSGDGPHSPLTTRLRAELLVSAVTRPKRNASSKTADFSSMEPPKTTWFLLPFQLLAGWLNGIRRIRAWLRFG